MKKEEPDMYKTDKEITEAKMRLDLAYTMIQREVKYIQEIAVRDQLISQLRNESGIAREAINRFCPYILRDIAEKWLCSKGL